MVVLRELIDIVIMTLAVGYIFMDFFRLRNEHPGFDARRLWLACLVTAPALIAHELAHKFTAIAMGFQAVFHAAYFWLGFGIVLKLVHAPLIFFVPGYVSIECVTGACTIPPLTSSLIAFAGPALNGALYLISWLVLRQRLTRSRRWLLFWFLTKRINGLLFILNMLPIPGFDGFTVYRGLFQTFF